VTKQPVSRGLGCWILRSEAGLQKGGTAYEQNTRRMPRQFDENAAGCPFPNSPLHWDAGFGCARVRFHRPRTFRPAFLPLPRCALRGFSGATNLCGDWQITPDQFSQAACRGSLMARSGFASKVKVAPFAVPSSGTDVFQQRLRGREFGSSHSPCASVRVPEGLALGCRFSGFRPYSGHPSSFSDFQRYLSSAIAKLSGALPLFAWRWAESPKIFVGDFFEVYLPAGASLRARTLNQIGVPSKPNAARIWFSRKRSKEKCSLMSRSVKRMKVGGATAA
jgi:hypothetical protein